MVTNIDHRQKVRTLWLRPRIRRYRYARAGCCRAKVERFRVLLMSWATVKCAAVCGHVLWMAELGWWLIDVSYITIWILVLRSDAGIWCTSSVWRSSVRLGWLACHFLLWWWGCIRTSAVYFAPEVPGEVDRRENVRLHVALLFRAYLWWALSNARCNILMA